MNSYTAEALRTLLLSKGFEDLLTDLKRGITARHVQDQTIKDMFGPLLSERANSIDNDSDDMDEDDGCRGCW